MMASALAWSRGLSFAAWSHVTIRLLAMAALFFACLPLYYLWRLFRLPNPWPRNFLSGVAWIAGVRVTVSGPRPSGPVFLISNHVSWIDIPALSQVTGSAFIGHDGLSALPVLEWLCRMNDTVFIARHDRSSVAGQVAQIRKALD